MMDNKNGTNKLINMHQIDSEMMNNSFSTIILFWIFAHTWTYLASETIKWIHIARQSALESLIDHVYRVINQFEFI